MSKSTASINAESGPWWVYIIQTRRGCLYTGITTDVERRFRQHAGELRGGARYFRTDPAVAVVFREPAANRSAASRREAEIKRLRRGEKLALIGARRCYPADQSSPT